VVKNKVGPTKDRRAIGSLGPNGVKGNRKDARGRRNNKKKKRTIKGGGGGGETSGVVVKGPRPGDRKSPAAKKGQEQFALGEKQEEMAKRVGT